MADAALHLEDFAPGQRYGSGKRIAVTAEEVTGFAARYDPQPFHLDEEAGRNSVFGGLAASGWHTAAMTMRMLVESDFWPAGGIVGAGMDELRWPRPVHPGDELHIETEILEGVADGVEADGALRLRLADGTLRRISAGDVFFGEAA